MIMFGTGYSYLKNAAGMNIPFALLESGEYDFSLDQKTLSGPYQIPLYSGNADAKITGKSTVREVDIATASALGLSQYIGATGLSDVPVVNAPMAVSTNTIAVNGATEILGVRDPLTSVSLVQVASSPVAGQFSVNETTITVAAADATTWGDSKPLVTYLKSATSDAHKVTLLNAVAQESVYFGITGTCTFNGKAGVVNFPRCTSAKIPLMMQKKDFASFELDVTVLANPATGIWGNFTLSESIS